MLIAIGTILTVKKYGSVPTLLGGVEARKQFRILILAWTKVAFLRSLMCRRISAESVTETELRMFAANVRTPLVECS